MNYQRQSIGETIAEKAITAAIFGLLFLGFFFAFNKAWSASEKNDCLKWQGYAKQYRLWYATDSEREQCDAVGVPLPPDNVESQAQADYIARLAIEAPETLRPPEPSQFMDEASYRAALARYALRGNWATEEGE